MKGVFNTLASRIIPVVHAKTAGLHVALCKNFSGPVRATDPDKSSKDLASLLVCTRKSFFGGCGFIVNDVISFQATLAHISWPCTQTVRR